MVYRKNTGVTAEVPKGRRKKTTNEGYEMDRNSKEGSGSGEGVEDEKNESRIIQRRKAMASLRKKTNEENVENSQLNKKGAGDRNTEIGITRKRKRERSNKNTNASTDKNQKKIKAKPYSSQGDSTGVHASKKKSKNVGKKITRGAKRTKQLEEENSIADGKLLEAQNSVPLMKTEGDSKIEAVAGSNVGSSQPVASVKVKEETENQGMTTGCGCVNGWNGSPFNTGLKYVGGHASAAGGLENAVTNAVYMKAKSFALFLRSQRKWESKPLEEETVEKFKQACKEHGYPSHLILPHGSYLMNLGSPSAEILRKSRELLLDELQRCERLGIIMYNFHPGSTCGEISREESIRRIAESINEVHKKCPRVMTVLENMSRQGNTIGGDFRELHDVIDQVKDKTRIGVCLDTCHAMAAGYDLSKEDGFQQMLADFDSIIGFQYLVAAHINDSKGKAGCHADRHENIGKGKIGKDGFRRLMNCPHFSDIPLILETPCESDDTYMREIQLLYKLEDYARKAK